MFTSLLGLEPDAERVVQAALAARGGEHISIRIDVRGLVVHPLVDAQREISV